MEKNEQTNDARRDSRNAFMLGVLTGVGAMVFLLLLAFGAMIWSAWEKKSYDRAQIEERIHERARELEREYRETREHAVNAQGAPGEHPAPAAPKAGQ